MKVRKLHNGNQIEVGDRIKSDSFVGVQWFSVSRVTKNYAFVRYNEHAEGKFPRQFTEMKFYSLPRQKWATTFYTAWRPIALGQTAAKGTAK